MEMFAATRAAGQEAARLLNRHRFAKAGCGHDQHTLRLEAEGRLRLERTFRAPRSGAPAGQRLPRCAAPDVAAAPLLLVMSLHDLGHLGVDPRHGRVTLFCRRAELRCIRVLAAWGGWERHHRWDLRLNNDPEGLRAVALALFRLRLRVGRDLHLVRPSGAAKATHLRASGRKLRDWGIALTVLGSLATGVGLYFLIPALDAPPGLGQSIGLGLGQLHLVPGLLGLCTGIGLLAAGVGRLQRARELDLQSSPGAAALDPSLPSSPTWRALEESGRPRGALWRLGFAF